MNDNNRKTEYGRTRQPQGNKSAPKKGQTALSPVKKKSKGLVAKTAKRALALRKEKDAKWEAGEIQRVRHGVDRPMLTIILVLLCLGTIMVFSASYPNALHEKNDSLYYIRNQLMWLTIGGILMAGVSFMPYKLFKRVTVPVTIAAIALLLLVLVMGTAEGVARRWLSVGFITLQPSEAAKAALILALALYMDKHYEIIVKRADKKKAFWQGVVAPGLIVGGFCALVLLEKHLSGTIILCLIGMSIIFVSGADIAKMLVTYAPVGVIAVVAYLLKNSYALERITTHGNENADVLGEAWQTTQGLYAIGSGGLFGLGLGNSNLKYNYVSAAHNDFIFTIWCEEMGLVGAVLLIALYGFFVWRGIVIARKAPDTFSSLTAFGITFQVGIQAVLNIMVVTDLIPNTGVSLPFFSYGGSSLVMLMCEMGILLSISRHSYQKK
ncbi:MAG: cell division protein FtsW [Ruminococcaceae bacterium]|nr:cell division protein FtsW [Oscillospiraceae bacterium]